MDTNQTWQLHSLRSITNIAGANAQGEPEEIECSFHLSISSQQKIVRQKKTYYTLVHHQDDKVIGKA